MSWKLVGISEGIAGQSMLLDRDILIGRHQQADLVLQSAQVSRRHAGIEYRSEDQSIWIQDLGSSNGTFVNGQQIQQATQLKHGDEIRFQDIVFQVQYDATAPQASTAQLEAEEDLTNNRPSDDGMPTLQERSVDVKVRADGTPQAVAIPKPAPIPEHIDIHAPQATEPTPSPSPSIDPEHAKNAKAGIITWIIIVVAVVIGLIAFLR